MTNAGNLIHIVDTVAKSLPLDNATVLCRYYLLSITYVGLVLALSEHPTIHAFVVIVRWVLCGTWHLNRNRGFEVDAPAEE